MSQVEAAILAGRCSLAVSGALLRDEQVVLALTERRALTPMTLDGPAQAPIVPISDHGLARAVGAPEGVLAIVEPGPADTSGLERLAGLMKTAPHRPQIVVVARQYDQLRFGMMFRGFKIAHVKARAGDWVKALPMPPAESEAPAPVVPTAKERKKAEEGPTVKLVFVGREEELATLTGMLGAGGPIVVSGPRGIGKSWLTEAAIAASGLTRLPDLKLGRGTGFDALIARLAVLTRAGGSDRLAQALTGPRTPPELVAAAIESLQGAAGTEGQVMVIDDLQVAAGREGDFFRKSRLELLLEALLTHTYPLRLVFLSALQPLFYREGRDAALRRLPLTGIKGRFYYDIFQAYGAPEFPRDKFGPMSEKLHGSPMAVRTAAVAIRHTEKLVDDEKFFRMEDAADTDVIVKQQEKRISKLSDELRAEVTRLAHLRIPLDVNQLTSAGIQKPIRHTLVAEGMLDLIGSDKAVRYVVHDLTRRALGDRETTDFRTFAGAGGWLAQLAAKAEGLEQLALAQEANRCLVAGREFRGIVSTEFPDHDGLVESTIGLIRAKTNPRYDIAARRLEELLKADPSNADAWLLRLELLRHQDAKTNEVQEAVDAAIAAAPVPEVFHEAVSFHLSRNARNKAIKVLEAGIAALPDQSRLRTRLASLLLRAGRRPEAIEHLQLAMAQDPMLPDAYGLLGMARREEGAERLEEAETLLREAVRLAPNDVVQASRLIWLLLDIAKGVPERAEAVAAELKTLLDGLLAGNKSSWEAHLLYAVAIRQSGGDLGRALWFLKKARQLAPRRQGVDHRLSLESALLDLSCGKLDEAERRLLGLSKKDPTDHRIFGGIAKVHEARGMLVAAHAETQRASERTSPHSLDRQAYDQELARLQALIAAGAGMISVPAPTPIDLVATPPEGESAEELPDVVEAPPEEGDVAAPTDGEETAADAAPSLFEDDVFGGDGA